MVSASGTRYPSIFNDVIGPVMRGPSSSHCAAALRIGRIARDLMRGRIRKVLVQFDPDGSLATTHESQGSDMGLFGGLLGWDATDERLPESGQAIRDAGVQVEIQIAPYGADHPNTYRLALWNEVEKHQLTALSTGGGMIEVVEVDGAQVSMLGDYYETLIYLRSEGDRTLQFLSERIEADEILLHRTADGWMIEVKGQAFAADSVLSDLEARFDVRSVKTLHPVLPVLSRAGMAVPFITAEEMWRYNGREGLELWELALRYECARGDLPPDQVLQQMGEVVRIMRASIRQGMAGTEYADRILGYQSGAFKKGMEAGRLLDAGMLNRIILYVTAMMEVKSAMGVIVAAPTAGSCGALPGACIGAAEAMGLGLDEMVRAMLVAGLIGVLIAARSTFAAEVGGCQAECGAGSGMAAAALVALAGGAVEQAMGAASMALQNTLGMTCDPVASRVEVPCLGKNILAASNALACANMALAGFDPVIPLDEVIETMDRVGRSLPSELRCTALGGLSTTRTSKSLEEQLARGEE